MGDFLNKVQPGSVLPVIIQYSIHGMITVYFGPVLQQRANVFGSKTHTWWIMLVLADLEETLIKDWTDPVFLPARLEIIKNHLANNPHAQLGLMSWAVWDSRDLDVFNRTLRTELEEQLGHRFSEQWMLSMDGWAQEMMIHGRKHVHRDEMFDLFGKEDVFLMMARRHPEWLGQEIFLFDDAVPQSTFSLASRGTVAHMVNIREMCP